MGVSGQQLNTHTHTHTEQNTPLYYFVVCLGAFSAFAQIVLHGSINVKIIFFCPHRCCKNAQIIF